MVSCLISPYKIRHYIFALAFWMIVADMAGHVILFNVFLVNLVISRSYIGQLFNIFGIWSDGSSICCFLLWAIFLIWVHFFKENKPILLWSIDSLGNILRLKSTNWNFPSQFPRSNKRGNMGYIIFIFYFTTWFLPGTI